MGFEPGMQVNQAAVNLPQFINGALEVDDVALREQAVGRIRGGGHTS